MGREFLIFLDSGHVQSVLGAKQKAILTFGSLLAFCCGCCSVVGNDILIADYSLYNRAHRISKYSRERAIPTLIQYFRSQNNDLKALQFFSVNNDVENLQLFSPNKHQSIPWRWMQT